MKRLFLLLAVALMAACGNKEKEHIKVYAGAGLRKAIDEIAAEFTIQHDIQVESDYAGSGILISKTRMDKTADIFLPGDQSYVERLNVLEQNIMEKIDVCRFVPVIITAKGNPKNVKSIADFKNVGLKVGLGKAEACRIGRVGDLLLENYGLRRTDLLEVQESLTVNELGVWVKMGSVDASVVWDAIAFNIKDDVEIIEIPKEKNIISKVVAGRLNTSKNIKGATLFMEFLKGDKAKGILKKNGYSVD